MKLCKDCKHFFTTVTSEYRCKRKLKITNTKYPITGNMLTNQVGTWLEAQEERDSKFFGCTIKAKYFEQKC